MVKCIEISCDKWCETIKIQMGNENICYITKLKCSTKK